MNELDPDDELVLRLWNWKNKFNVPDAAFDGLQDVFPDVKLPTVRTARRKMQLLSDYNPQTYDCCINCCLCYVGVNEDLEKCVYCKEDRWKDGKPRKVFHYLPIIPRLIALYANKKLTELMGYRHKFERREGKVEDIFDGLVYKTLLETKVVVGDHPQDYTFFSAETDIALGVATDGFSPFKNRKQTCWPIVVYNLNLPPDLRILFEHLICAGVIPGPKKPKDFDSFLFPFTMEGLELALGVAAKHCLRKEEVFALRAYALFFAGDMPALAMVLRMKGHNAFCPCRMCKILAILSANRKTYYVPLKTPAPMAHQRISYKANKLPLRTHDEFLKDARAVDSANTNVASEKLAKKTGIKGVPILSHLPSLFFPHSFPYDFMHLTYENLIKNLIDFFCGTFKELDHENAGYLVDTTVWAAIGEATLQSGSTIPGAYGARPRDFSDGMSGVTADNLAFWTLFLGPVYLEKSISKEFYQHFVELVKLVNLCLQFEVTSEQIHQIRKGFEKWVEDYER